MTFPFRLTFLRAADGRTAAASDKQRRRACRLHLELLEERLPPGDAVLGGLLANALAEPGLADRDSIPWLPESSSRTEVPATRRLIGAETSLVQETGSDTAPLPSFVPHSTPTEPKPHQDTASAWTVPLGDAEPGWEALGSPLPRAHPSLLLMLASGQRFETAPTAEDHTPANGMDHPASTRAGGLTETVRAGAGASSSPEGGLPMGASVSDTGQGTLPTDPDPVTADDPHAAIQAGFDLSTVAGGPFPSNRFTVRDRTQNTDRRVNLPLPDALVRPSDVNDVALLNTLDGFNLQPRLSIPFNGPINLATVNSHTVFLVSLGSTLPGGDHGGQVVGINQVVWDPARNVLHAESDELLEQHTRYALIVTRGIRDAAGLPVEASAEFRLFRQNLAQTSDPVLRDYRRDLLDAVEAARELGVRERDIVTASVFTTQSATAILEKIRDQIHAGIPAAADFRLGPGGTRTLFALNEISAITMNQQTRTDPALPLTPFTIQFPSLRLIPGAVGQIAFGKYLSPNYLTTDGVIPPVGTRSGTPLVRGVNEISLMLVLPSGAKPAGGWPVAIFGHGGTGFKEQIVRVGATMAAHGIATIGINNVGHGFGPRTTLTISQTGAGSVTFPEGGRGLDVNGDGTNGSDEGYAPRSPQILAFGQNSREGSRQTVVDLMQLTRVIQVGMDVDGDGTRDLDPRRISYFGQSLGSLIGTAFLAVEPGIRAGVLDVVGGELLNMARQHAPAYRPSIGNVLAARVPSLLNTPGLTSLGGLPVGSPTYNENQPQRGQPPVSNTVPGAMEIQEVIDRAEWFTMLGDPIAYVPHLRKDPLPGVPAKSVLVQFARGDQNIVNPQTSAYLRAGDLANRATFYRNDRAFAEDSTVPKNPHGFVYNVVTTNPLVTAIALGAQEQMATFFASDGVMVLHPEPARFFETPIQGPLPEDYNFIP